MTTTYTNEQLIERLKKERIPYNEAKTLCQEPYNEEVFILGIKTRNFQLHMIPEAQQTEAIQLVAIEQDSWCYRDAKSPSYQVSLRAVELRSSNLSKVPKDQRTEELCDLAIDSAIRLRQTQKKWQVCKLSSIPKSLRTPERVQRFLQLDGNVINHLASETSTDRTLIRQAIQTTPSVIKEMDLNSLEESELVLALSLNGGLLEVIPEALRSEAIIEAALKQDGYAIRYIQHPTLEQMELLLNFHPYALKSIKEQVPLHLLKKAISKCYFTFSESLYHSHKVIAPHFLGALIDQSPYLYPVRYSYLFDSQSSDIKGELNYFLAKETGQLIEGMGVEEWLLALSSPVEGADYYKRFFEQKATNNHPLHSHQIQRLIKIFLTELDYDAPVISDNLKANDRQKLVREDGRNLRRIDHLKQTKKLASLALKQTPEALKYVNPKFKDYRTCRLAIRHCEKMKLYSPYHVETEINERLIKKDVN